MSAKGIAETLFPKTRLAVLKELTKGIRGTYTLSLELTTWLLLAESVGLEHLGQVLYVIGSLDGPSYGTCPPNCQ